jgi:hypothetical protein
MDVEVLFHAIAPPRGVVRMSGAELTRHPARGALATGDPRSDGVGRCRAHPALPPRGELTKPAANPSHRFLPRTGA